MLVMLSLVTPEGWCAAKLCPEVVQDAHGGDTMLG